MDRAEILKELKKFFDIEELVCDHTFAKWGKNAWQFLDTAYLHCLLVIRRDILKRAMWCNGSSQHQRGLRCNLCPLVKEKKTSYLSSHIFGKAGDFTVSGMTAEQARQLIKANADLLPCSIRLEKAVSWLHFDVLPQYGVETIIYEFDG